LARDEYVVKAELNFQGSVAPTRSWASSWVGLESSRPGENNANGGRGKGGDAPPATGTTPATGRDTPPQDGAPALAADGSKASIVVPLHVTISVGTPTRADAALRVGLVASTDAAAGEALIEKVPVIYPEIELREGYQEDFLELANGKT